MTRKQFFKSIGLDQPKDKQPFIDLIKSYGGKLSYLRMYLLISTAIMFGRQGTEILFYIQAIMDSEKSKKISQTVK